MNGDNGDTQRDNGINPVVYSAVTGCERLKRLIIYIVYSVVVLAIGAKYGAFHRRSLFHSNVSSLTTQPVSASMLPQTLAMSVLLPQGILAFDAELKQTTVHEGDEQAHFVFNVTNISSKDVIISAVTTSCGCTTAELPQMPWNLPSRAKGQIPVTVNVLGHTGKDSKTVTVVTVQGSKMLNVEANILAVVDSNNISAH